MSGLIVAEVAIAMTLVSAAAMLVQSFARLHATDPGFAAAGRLVIDVRPTRTFTTQAQGRAWADEMIQRVRAAAAGTPVGSAWTFPLRTDRDGVFNIELQSDPPDPYRVRTARVRVVSPGFFEAMGIKSLAGRVLTA